MKLLWMYRIFIVREGWQEWDIKEVEIVAETVSYYQIKYKLFGLFYTHEWIPKSDNANKFEHITQKEEK